MSTAQRILRVNRALRMHGGHHQRKYDPQISTAEQTKNVECTLNTVNGMSTLNTQRRFCIGDNLQHTNITTDKITLDTPEEQAPNSSSHSLPLRMCF